MAKTQTTLTMDGEVLSALEARATAVGMSVDEWVERLLRKEFGFDLLDRLQQRNSLRERDAMTLALQAQQAVRRETAHGWGEAYEAAWWEVADGADAQDDPQEG